MSIRRSGWTSGATTPGPRRPRRRRPGDGTLETLTDRVMNPRETMRAWVVEVPGPVSSHPLRAVERAVPEPGPGEFLVSVEACGVCRTDLHLAEGDLPPRRPSTTPGHEVVGRVEALGSDAGRFSIGERVGVPWLGAVDGTCPYCRRGAENLCSAPTFTGWDRDG